MASYDENSRFWEANEILGGGGGGGRKRGGREYEVSLAELKRDVLLVVTAFSEQYCCNLSVMTVSPVT